MESPTPAQPSRTQPILLGAALVAATVLLYLPVVHHDFLRLWDDDAYVTENIHVRTGLTLANARWAFTSFEQSNWHPLTWLSYMIDCQLFGLNSAAQHSENVVWHAANVLLLFWILQRVTGAVWRSFAVAAIWAMHPVNVETVAWVAQRKSLLSAFFSLLTVAAYGWYVRRRGWKPYAVMVTAFAMALLSKAMAVSLPVLLLLFDYWPLQRLEDASFSRRWSRLFVEKIPLFLMSAASSLLTEVAQRSGGSVMQLALLPLPTRIENAIVSYTAYIGKIVWPARLSTYYPLQFSPLIADVIASAIVLLAITAFAFYFRRARYLAVGWIFFLLTLVPVIGIVQVGFQGMADRYAYIPSIGLLVAVIWGVASLAENVRSLRVALAFAAVCVTIGLSIATVRYLACWRNSVTLFAQVRAASSQPDFWVEQLYGNALYSAGRVDEALDHYEQSCTLQPRTEYCHYNIAHIFLDRRQFREAISEYQLALRYTASRDIVLLCLDESGEAWLQLGDYDAAEQAVVRALTIDPSNETALRLRQQILNRKAGN